MSSLTHKFNKINQFLNETKENKFNLINNRTKTIYEPRLDEFNSTHVLFNGSVKGELF